MFFHVREKELDLETWPLSGSEGTKTTLLVIGKIVHGVMLAGYGSGNSIFTTRHIPKQAQRRFLYHCTGKFLKADGVLFYMDTLLKLSSGRLGRYLEYPPSTGRLQKGWE